MNKLTGKQSKQENKGLELKIDNQLVRNPGILAQEFNSFFINSIEDLVKQFTSLKVSDQQVSNSSDNIQPKFNIQEITKSEVLIS